MKREFLVAVMALFSMTAFANGNDVSIEPTNVTVENNSEATAEEFYEYDRRFSAITEVGTAFAGNQAYFNLYQAIGMRINPYFFIGQGVGIQVSNNRIYQMHTTADFRAYVLDKKVTPMFIVQAGINKVGNAPETETKQLKDLQLMMNAGTGILIKAKPNASFTINGGYTLYSDFKQNIHGGFVKVGYVF
ncbi:MAG: hypothetical protein IT275_06880 [Chitinophagales bacterium]|nr:hypothetical protein [Chitinophagales bacterium]